MTNTMNLKKIKKIIFNDYFILSFLTILGLFIRLLDIDKPKGLWNDEMISYVISVSDSLSGVIKTVLKEDFHMPLYYLYLNVWTRLFGSDDVILRLSSVLWGVLSIPASFYLGKACKSKSLGYLLAAVVTISPIMIFYSQELRFYPLLIFFSIISLTFFLKLIDAPLKKYFLWFFLSNLVILYLYTMGIIFVFAEIAILLYHFYKYKRENFKLLTIYIAAFSLTATPYLIMLGWTLHASEITLFETLGWSALNKYSLLFILNDWLSPYIKGCFNQDPFVYAIWFISPFMLSLLTYFTLTSFCFIAGFIISLRNLNQKLIYLLIILLFFLSTELFLCLRGTLAVATKYTMIIFPIVLLICCNGLLSIKKRWLKVFILCLISIIFVHNIINYQKALSYKCRPDGMKIPANLMLEQKPEKNDYIMYPFYTKLVEKYIPDAKFIDFSFLGIISIDKTKQEQYKLFNKEFIETTNKHNSIDKLLPYISNPKPTEQLRNYMNSTIDKIPKGNRLILGDGGMVNIKYNPEKDKITDMDQYRRSLWQYTSAKIFWDIRKIIETNPSMQSLGVRTNPNWPNYKVYIYRKK